MIIQPPVGLAGPFKDAVDRVRSAYSAAGFETTAEVNLQPMADRDGGDHVVLATLHPAVTADALSADETVGVLLPYHVAVRETDDGVVVEAADPKPPGAEASTAAASATAQLRRHSCRALRILAGGDQLTPDDGSDDNGNGRQNLEGGLTPTRHHRSATLGVAGMTVGDVMTGDLVAVRPVDSVAMARQVLHETGLHALPVIDEKRLVGVVTLADFHGQAGTTPLHDVVVVPPVTITTGATLIEAADLMRTEGLHHLIVTEDDGTAEVVIGMLSTLDLIRSIS